MVQLRQDPRTSWKSVMPPRQRRMVAGGAIGTLMEYYDYYLYKRELEAAAEKEINEAGGVGDCRQAQPQEPSDMRRHRGPSGSCLAVILGLSPGTVEPGSKTVTKECDPCRQCYPQAA